MNKKFFYSIIIVSLLLSAACGKKSASGNGNIPSAVSADDQDGKQPSVTYYPGNTYTVPTKAPESDGNDGDTQNGDSDKTYLESLLGFENYGITEGQIPGYEKKLVPIELLFPNNKPTSTPTPKGGNGGNGTTVKNPTKAPVATKAPTKTPTKTPTRKPTPTNTPKPTSTPIPTPTPTPTPRVRPTHTPTPTGASVTPTGAIIDVWIITTTPSPNH